MEPVIDGTLIGAVIVVAGFLFLGAIIALIRWFISFREELRDIDFEIERTKGQKREWWLRRKRRLWLSIIPFVKY